MAFIPSQYLNLTDATQLRDQQHAARLFSDDGFRLLPKTKFLYHVSFNINQAALKSIELVQRHRNEINMLVKSVDLPYYTISTETLNQYNRKKNVVTGHKYNNLNIKFHDDNMGLINQLWQNYYSYYFADSTQAQNAGAYNRTATKNSNYITGNYGFDNGSILPFFNYITIYQLARHEYLSYKLINPIFSSWNHNALDSSQGTQVNDNAAIIQYEAVAYGSGQISAGDPEGFGIEHYDTTPSPLQGGSGFTTASPSFVSNVNVQANGQAFLDNLTSTVNGYQNTKEPSTQGTPGLISKLVQSAQQGVSGIQGIAFPVSNAITNTIAALPVKLG